MLLFLRKHMTLPPCFVGIVNDILSWPAWFPLSRLTYSAYLLHPVLLLVYIGSMRETVFIDNLHTV